jgi:flagellar motor switch protein FliN/FliY
MTIDMGALGRLGDVQVNLAVELGRTQLPLKQVIGLAEGSVVALERLTDELLDVTANGELIAKAEVIARDGRFALRIVELAGDRRRSEADEWQTDAQVAAPPQTAPNPAAQTPPEMPDPNVPMRPDGEGNVP